MDKTNTGLRAPLGLTGGQEYTQRGAQKRYLPIECGTSGKKNGETADHLTDIRRDGDVESNPGPECNGCRKKIRRDIQPLECERCKAKWHGTCSRLRRAKIEKIKKKQEAWNCCLNNNASREENSEGNNWQRELKNKRDGKERCAKCSSRLVRSMIIICCKKCRKYYHHKCVNETQSVIRGAIKEGRWKCDECEQGKIGEIDEREEEGELIESSKEKMVKMNAKKLRVVQWNADGITNKKIELEEKLRIWQADIVIIQETKLRQSQKTPLFTGYTTVRKDRKYIRKDEDRKGGGLITLVKKNIPYRRLRGWKGKTTEGLSLLINMSTKQRIRVTNVYRPPINHREDMDE